MVYKIDHKKITLSLVKYIITEMVDDAVYFKPNRHRYKISAAMLVVFIVTCLCALRGFQVEAILRVRLEEMELFAVDPKYFDPSETKAFIVEDIDNDETSMTSKLVIVEKMPENAQGHVEIRGLSMGKYTLDTGISYTMGICDMLNEPIMMGPFLAVLGFTADSCPPKPGIYTKDGYILPVEVLPDEFPENKYLFYFEIKTARTPIFRLNIYLQVQYE